MFNLCALIKIICLENQFELIEKYCLGWEEDHMDNEILTSGDGLSTGTL